jgi:beta-glucosidase
MKTRPLLSAIVLLASACVRAESPAVDPAALAPDLQPVTACFRPKSDEYYQWAMDRHDALVKQAREQDIEVAFYGDSLIHFLDDEVWAKEAVPMKAGNFGISSDRVEHLLWRLQHGELEGLRHLKVAVVMIGSNNYGTPSSAASIAAGIELVCKTIRQRQPQASILLLGLSPEGWNKDDDSRLRIKAINDLLAGFKARQICDAYLDWGGVLLNADGSMNKNMSKDGCHYSKDGSAAFFAAVKPALRQCLKPAAHGKNR